MKETKPILANGKPIGNGTLPIVITPLVGKTQAAILDEVAAIIPKTPDLLEWRIDFFEAIGNTQAVIETALAIRAASKGIPVLLTRRNASEGGQPLTIAEPAVVAMYTAACQAKCVELIDYELSNAPANTPGIREHLELVRQQWFFFENALAQKSGPDKRPQTAVATTSERILEEMESVVALYERLPK